MPTYNTDAVYGLRALLGGNLISDIDTGFASLRDDVASKMKGAVPRVTSLPTVGPLGSGALVDGQECYFVADATNGVIWHLRYNAGSTSPYKWEFVGGSGLVSAVTPSESTTSAAITDLTTVGPSVTLPTLPSGGDFNIDICAAIAGASNPANAGRMSAQVSGTTLVSINSQSSNSTLTDGEHNLSAFTRATGLNSAAVVLCRYNSDGTHAVTFRNRVLRVTPVRVG